MRASVVVIYKGIPYYGINTAHETATEEVCGVSEK